MFPVAILSIQSEFGKLNDITIRPIPNIYANIDTNINIDIDSDSDSDINNDININADINAKVIDYDFFVNKNIMVIGKCGSNKSWFTMSFYDKIKELNKFKRILVVAPAESFAQFYGLFPPNTSIHMKLTDNVIKEINSLDDESLVILDDCIGHTNEWNKKFKMLKHTFVNSKITVLIHCQLPIFGPKFVNICDVIVFAEENSEHVQKQFHEYTNIIGHRFDFSQFKQIVNNAKTNNFIMFKNLNIDINAIVDAKVDKFHKNVSMNNDYVDLCTNHNSHSYYTNNNNNNCLPINEFKISKNVTSPILLIMNPNHETNINYVKTIFCRKESPYTHAIVFSKTNRHHYKDITKNRYKDLRQLQNIITLTKIANKNDRKNNNPSLKILIIIDHMINSETLKNQLLQEIIYNGRSYGFGVVVIESYPVRFSPEIRSNFDYVLMNCGKYVSASIMKELYEKYGDMFPNINSFEQLYKQLCETSYDYFVIINRGFIANLFDKIAWMRQYPMSESIKLKNTKQFPLLNLPTLPKFPLINSAITNKLKNVMIEDGKNKLNNIMCDLHSLMNLFDDISNCDISNCDINNCDINNCDNYNNAHNKIIDRCDNDDSDIEDNEKCDDNNNENVIM